MNKIQCPEGHFYDSDSYSSCPMCARMENIGKAPKPEKPAKKNPLSKKSKEESAPAAEEPKKEPVRKKQPRKKQAPSQGNIVTVAILNPGADAAEDENKDILDESGRIKVGSKPAQKSRKIIEEDSYITAAEIVGEKEKQKNLKKEQAAPEPEEKPEEEIIKSEESELTDVKSQPEAEDNADTSEEEPDTAEEAEISEDEISDTEGESEAEEPQDDAAEPETAEEGTEDDSAEMNVSRQIKADAKENAPVSFKPEKSPEKKPENVVYTAPASGSKTVGMYNFETEPVVGWLVSVSGDIKGKSFKLKAGQNIIGNSGIMDVYLPESNKKQNQTYALLIFEPNKKEYILRPTGEVTCTVNDEKISGYAPVKSYDKIRIGEYMLVFKSLCSDKFDWKDYED